jgi:hypothetical protein
MKDRDVTVNNERNNKTDILNGNLSLSKEYYSEYRDQNDQAIRIGVFEDDLEKAYDNQRTKFIQIASEEDGAIYAPVLVPVDVLDWYNTELIRETYGRTDGVFYFAHPPVNNEQTSQEVIRMVSESLERGDVVITDVYADSDSPIIELINEADSNGIHIDTFGGEVESRVDVFVGKVAVNEHTSIFSAPTLYSVYSELLSTGEIPDGTAEGVSLQEVITGAEAEKIWEIYEKPFEDLGRDDPTHAGFDKEELLDILKDPDVTKIINRVDGEITTLCFFLHNFDKAPWFNSDNYKRNYPEYFETGNILMFPGIVSDENKRGNNYALDLIDFATRLSAKRGSDFIITFECTEISTQYIPEIVTAAVNNGGYARITGLENPVSEIRYLAISKPKL